MGQHLSPIRVATFNIKFGEREGPNRWELRRPSTLGMIQQLNADILGLQEALDFQVDEIKSALPHHRWVGVGRDDGRRAGEFVPIFFDSNRFKLRASGTYWFSDTPEVPGSRHWGNENVRCCTWATLDEGGELFTVINLHIDHASQPSRERSTELLLARLGPGPNIVMGDFNATEDNPALEPLRAAGLRDAYRVIHTNEPDAGTFHDWTGRFDQKIDTIWLDANWDVRAAELLRGQVKGRWPSDHAPVVATVIRRPAGA